MSIFVRLMVSLAIILVLNFNIMHAAQADTKTQKKTSPQKSTSKRKTVKRASSGNYLIGAGDTLIISVWKDESLTRQVVVLPDGTISFPLIGQLRAAGRGLKELTDIVTKRLSQFVPDPVISMEVSSVNSLMVYVIGKVMRPGRFELQSEINVLQGLALAGGLNTFAKEGQIRIFRKSAKGTQIYRFDYDAVIRGKDLKQNIQLKRGDIIVVP